MGVDISSLDSGSNVLKRELESSTSIFSVKSVAARELYVFVVSKLTMIY